MIHTILFIRSCVHGWGGGADSFLRLIEDS